MITSVETRHGEKAVRLVGRKIHVLRCLRGQQVEVDGEVGYMRGGLFIPDRSATQTPFFEILAVSDDCLHFRKEHVGKKVLLPMDTRRDTRKPDGNPNAIEVLPYGERIVYEELFDRKDVPLAVFD